MAGGFALVSSVLGRTFQKIPLQIKNCQVYLGLGVLEVKDFKDTDSDFFNCTYFRFPGLRGSSCNMSVVS